MSSISLVRGGSDDAGELFVVVDEGDTVLGVRTRGDCHRDPSLIHRSVHVLVETADGMLFQRRGFGKDTGAGSWDTACAGHVAHGESYAGTAVRELEEELGLTGCLLEPIGTTLVRLDRETEMCAVFLVRHDGPFCVRLPEVVGLSVFPEGELPAPLTDSARHVLAFAASQRPAL